MDKETPSFILRDPKEQGTKYNASSCLIQGLSVVADSFAAIDKFLKERPSDACRLLEALRTNFEEDEELHQYLQTCPKYGNNIAVVDQEARDSHTILRHAKSTRIKRRDQAARDAKIHT